MIKKQIYSKTERIRNDSYRWLITEKLDGSNLCLFRLNGILHCAQRKQIFAEDEFASVQYRGLAAWLNENREALEALAEGAAVMGEWMGMGTLKYPPEYTGLFMFARGHITPEMSIQGICYDPDEFRRAFTNGSQPEAVHTVPIAGVLDRPPDKMYLDRLYDTYARIAGRPVEGFVITMVSSPPEGRCKYVRMKRGELREHDFNPERA